MDCESLGAPLIRVLKEDRKKDELGKMYKEPKLKDSDLKVAKDSIYEGNMELPKALKESKLSRKVIQEAQMS